MRVQILKDFVKQHFPATQLLDYALDVEKITTSKVSVCLWPSHLNMLIYVLGFVLLLVYYNF